MLSLREHILSCASVSADARELRVTRSERLDTVSVAFPAGIDLESRADHMNAFWEDTTGSYCLRVRYRDARVGQTSDCPIGAGDAAFRKSAKSLLQKLVQF